MLDPKEQAKGGFRAQVERANERRQARLEADARDAATADAPAGTPRPAVQQADGSDDADPQQGNVHSAPATPPARRPRHWH